MSDTESLQLQFDALVCQQSPDQLLKLVEFLKIKDPVSKKNKVRNRGGSRPMQSMQMHRSVSHDR